jgi:hypothetical protein
MGSLSPVNYGEKFVVDNIVPCLDRSRYDLQWVQIRMRANDELIINSLIRWYTA